MACEGGRSRAASSELRPSRRRENRGVASAPHVGWPPCVLLCAAPGHEPGSGGRAGKCSARGDGAWRLRPVGSTCGRAQLGQEGAGVPGGAAASFSAAAARSDGF